MKCLETQVKDYCVAMSYMFKGDVYRTHWKPKEGQESVSRGKESA